MSWFNFNQKTMKKIGNVLGKFKKKLNLKKAAAIFVMVFFISSITLAQVNAATKKAVNDLVEKSNAYMLDVTHKIKNSDISSKTKISYKKLSLKNNIKSKDIKNGEVKTADLQNGAVTLAKLANDVVGQIQIKEGSIKSGNIQDGAIVTIKLANGVVTSAKIENGAITEDKISDDSISNSKIVDGAVTGIKIANDAIISAKIVDGAVTNGKLSADAVASINLIDGSVVTTKISDGAITAAKIGNNEIAGEKLAANINIDTTGSIKAVSFTDGTTTISGGDISTTGSIFGNFVGAVVGNVIGNITGNVTGNLFGNADTVTDGVYTSGVYNDPTWLTGIGASKIVGSITGSQVTDGTLTGDKLAADGSMVKAIVAGPNVSVVNNGDGTWTVNIANGVGLGTITDVIAGAGLTDGGNLGAVTLNVGAGTGMIVEVDTIGIADGGVGAQQIADGAIISSKLADGSVVTSKILDGSITGGKIAAGTILDTMLADGSIVTSKIADNAITEIKLADDSVVESKIQNLAVTTVKLADGSVTAAKILDGTITEGKLADDSITTIKLANDAVTTAKIADGTVLATDLADGIITTAKLADDSVATIKIIDGAITSGKIQDGSIVTVKLADGSVTGAKIENGAVGNVQLSDGSVTTVKIVDGAVTSGKLADGSVITSKIADASISGGKIMDSAITPAHLSDGAVTTSKIADGAITNEKIADGEITGDKLDSAINVSTSGLIEANALSDGTTTLNGGNINSTNNAMNINVASNGSDSDVFIRNSGSGSANLNVEGDVIGGGTLGSSSSRWSTIYADAINFLTGLTNDDNSGTPSTIKLGTAGGDASQIQIGNSNASVDLKSANWQILPNGKTAFTGVDLSGDITSSESRSIDMSNSSSTVFTITNSGTGSADLNVDRNGIFGGSITSGGRFTVTTGGMNIAGLSDFNGAVDMHGNVVQNIGDNATDFTTNGGLNLAGKLTANGGIDMSGNDISGVNDLSVTGSINLDSAKLKIPNGTMLPLVCSKGEIFLKTDGQVVTIGGNPATAYMFACVGSNNWKPATN